MGIDLGKFGPQLPTGNSKDVLGKLQKIGLPNPSDSALQKGLLDQGLAGPSMKTNFDSADTSQLMAARSAPQVYPSDAETAEALKDNKQDGTIETPNPLDKYPQLDNYIKTDQFAQLFDSTSDQSSDDEASEVYPTDAQTAELLELQNRDKWSSDNPYAADGGPEAVTPQETPQRVKSGSYTKVRIPWELTTTRRLALGLPSILFYVNPSSVRFNLQLTQSLDQVQRGWFMTIWKDYDGEPNFFSMLRMNFTFQSSNILPETYSNPTVATTFDGKNDLASIQSDNTAKQDYIESGGGSSYDGNIPPGLRNFYDILDLLNENRIINIQDEADWQDSNVTDVSKSLKAYDGEPNYVLLKISTRIFPKMWCMGFIENGLDWSENAINPLEFEVPISFVAFKTDPAWWDVNKIKTTYIDFWTKYFGGGGTASTAPRQTKAEESVPIDSAAKDALERDETEDEEGEGDGIPEESKDSKAPPDPAEQAKGEPEPAPPPKDDDVKKKQIEEIKAKMAANQQLIDQTKAYADPDNPKAQQVVMEKASLEAAYKAALAENPQDPAKVAATKKALDDFTAKIDSIIAGTNQLIAENNDLQKQLDQLNSGK
jgi:hypothetical protein